MSTAVMIMPGVQKPHCRPWCSRKASCIGCSGAPSGASPSMVFTSWPSAITASVVQDLTALPSRCTTQAPHCEVSQPTWVPVSRRFSRRNCTSSVRGSTLAVTGLPFTISEILAIGTLYNLRYRVARQHSHQNRSNAHNMEHRGNEQPRREPKRLSEGSGGVRAPFNGFGEIRKELVGQLAPDLRLDIVGQQRAAILFGEPDRRAALGEAGDTALALARDLVAVGRI